MTFQEFLASLPPDNVYWPTPNVAYMEIEPRDVLLVQDVWSCTIYGSYAFFIRDGKSKGMVPRLRLVFERDVESLRDASFHQLEQSRTAFRAVTRRSAGC